MSGKSLQGAFQRGIRQAIRQLGHLPPPRFPERTMLPGGERRGGVNLHPDLNSSNLDAHLAQLLGELRGELAQFGGNRGVVGFQYQCLSFDLQRAAGAQQ